MKSRSHYHCRKQIVGTTPGSKKTRQNKSIIVAGRSGRRATEKAVERPEADDDGPITSERLRSARDRPTSN